MNTLDLLAGLADWSFKSTVALLVAVLLTVALRREASTRRLIWIATFALILVIPILTAQWAAPEELLSLRVTAPDLTNPLSIKTQSGSLIGVLPGILLTVWGAGACFCILNTFAGYVALRRLLRRSELWTPEVVDLDQLSGESRVKRWELRRLAHDIAVPAMTWGGIRPIVLLPKSADTWQASHLRSVLLHELAHARRADSSLQIGLRLLCSLLWFHPLAWVGAAAFRTASEELADQSVLEAGVHPSDYASTLIAMAQELRGARSLPPVAAVPLLTAVGLEQRVAAVVRSGHRRAGSIVQTAVASAFVLVACVGACSVRAVAVWRPQPDEASSYSQEFMDGYRAGLNYGGNPPPKGWPPATLPPHLEEEAARKRTMELSEIAKRDGAVSQ